MPQETSQPARTWIRSVKVEGLHHRLDFEVKLRPGVNIIYGKNGIGKTTLLHIIANITEVDIDRFRYLAFSKIVIENSANQTVSIIKFEKAISVYINDQETSYISEKTELSEVERESIRFIVGERATYLPAFRSVLERMREGAYNNYEERTNPHYDAARQAEAYAFSSVKTYDRPLRREASLIDSNVVKTLRCRDWFGNFVPVIRYPSLADVVLGLSDEWASAQIAISKIDQKQFETAFVEIFSAIAKGDMSNDQQDQQALLDEIREIGSFDDSRVQGPPRMSPYLQLVAIAEKTNDNGRNYANILEIYRNKLLDRKKEREIVLSPINAFQDSVNVFLSEKAFRIGVRYPTSTRVRESNVFIEPKAGNTYRIAALSSGERQIVTMLYSASRSPFRAGCCLIDEPELSLHVDWQRIILTHIEKQYQGRQIIACTHSPEVGADHEERVQFFSPQSINSPEDDLEADEGVGL